MQPFKDMDLRIVLSANMQKMAARVDSFTNEEKRLMTWKFLQVICMRNFV